MTTRPWVITVCINNIIQTCNAISDALAQTVEPNVLVIDNGSTGESARAIDIFAANHELAERIFVWHHAPPLRSLAATWNAALDFVWSLGNEETLVINNDVRLSEYTYELLSDAMFLDSADSAFFVSGVGVTPEQFKDDIPTLDFRAKGGPDFSCYLISKECHAKYRFDENYIPAFCEDCSYHRELMLNGDGAKIFSVNVPYLHINSGSNTLKSMTPEQRAATEQLITHGSRAYYQRRWGGPPNAETFMYPFNKQPPENHPLYPAVTNPELQARIKEESANG